MKTGRGAHSATNSCESTGRSFHVSGPARIGGDASIPALVEAHGRGGEGLRAAAERGLRLIGSPAAMTALRGLGVADA